MAIAIVSGLALSSAAASVFQDGHLGVLMHAGGRGLRGIELESVAAQPRART